MTLISSITNAEDGNVTGTPQTGKSHSRIIDLIIASPNAELAKRILSWVIAAPRPLSIAELAEAVRLDISLSLTSPPSQHLERITGPLIVVDGQSRVHIAHETTVALLTEPHKRGTF